MCNLFDESCFKVISKFDEETPKSVIDIVNAFNDKIEITYLELYGDSLAHYISDLSKYGYLDNRQNGYVLSQRGLNKLQDLKTICQIAA